MKREFRTIQWQMEGTKGILRLSQPPSNGMTPLFFEEMSVLHDVIHHHRDLRGIVITGEGRHFSSGTQLDELLSHIVSESESGVAAGDESGFLARNYRSVSFFEKLQMPVISAVRGVCLGSAFELALFSHFRFCSEDAVFGLPETTFNLMPGLGGVRRMTELAGTAVALELILRGKTFGAEEALGYQLVDRIVPKKELLAFSLGFIDKITDGYHPQKRALYITKYLNDHGDPSA